MRLLLCLQTPCSSIFKRLLKFIEIPDLCISQLFHLIERITKAICFKDLRAVPLGQGSGTLLFGLLLPVPDEFSENLPPTPTVLSGTQFAKKKKKNLQICFRLGIELFYSLIASVSPPGGGRDVLYPHLCNTPVSYINFVSEGQN